MTRFAPNFEANLVLSSWLILHAQKSVWYSSFRRYFPDVPSPTSSWRTSWLCLTRTELGPFRSGNSSWPFPCRWRERPEKNFTGPLGFMTETEMTSSSKMKLRTFSSGCVESPKTSRLLKRTRKIHPNRRSLHQRKRKHLKLKVNIFRKPFCVMASLVVIHYLTIKIGIYYFYLAINNLISSWRLTTEAPHLFQRLLAQKRGQKKSCQVRRQKKHAQETGIIIRF